MNRRFSFPGLGLSGQLFQRWTKNWNGDLAILLLLFIQFRLFAVFFLRPGGDVYVGEQDVLFFRRMAELSLAGYYPYLHFWMEYPPIFPWIVVGIYRLSLLLPAWPSDVVWFHVGLGILFSAFDFGNIIFIYLLAKALHGPQIGLRAAWIYVLLFFPMYVTLNWFDTMPLFFLLLTTWLALKGHARFAGAAAGIGFMVKVIPILAVPVALQSIRNFTGRIGYIVSCGVAVAAIAAPFVVANPSMFFASVLSIVSRPSWESIWAFLEGFYEAGVTLPFSARFDVQTATFQVHPSTLPWPLINGIFLLICLVLYTRRLAWFESKTQLAVLALTLNLFLLFSKGYSPQFMVYVLAFVAILLPDLRGVVYAFLLTAVCFIEYPWAFGFFRLVRSLQWLTVGIRTGLLLCLCIEYARLLFADSSIGWAQQWLRRTERLWLAAAPAAVLAIGLCGVLIVKHYYAEPQDAISLASYVRASRLTESANVSSSRAVFYRINPLLPSSVWLVAEDENDQWPESLEQRLDGFAQGRSHLRVIIDHNTENASLQHRLLRWLDGWGSPASHSWFGKYELIDYASTGS
ncbi:MAG: hypothetical protein ACM3S0_11595 [Acidobacteriota bacterium]